MKTKEDKAIMEIDKMLKHQDHTQHDVNHKSGNPRNEPADTKEPEVMQSSRDASGFNCRCNNPEHHSPCSLKGSVDTKEPEDEMNANSEGGLPRSGNTENSGFDLSEKIIQRDIDVRHVKEFIKLRNGLDMDLRYSRITWQKYISERNKIAGDELVK